MVAIQFLAECQDFSLILWDNVGIFCVSFLTGLHDVIVSLGNIGATSLPLQFPFGTFSLHSHSLISDLSFLHCTEVCIITVLFSFSFY